jgi:peptidoglycan/LPS O-acetylase OafA/YrhL
VEPKKYQYIDSLRGLAILLVLLLHCWQIDNSSAYFPVLLKGFLENGQYGVQLFFMVSAYTLMLSHHSRRDESHATRNFFIRRFFRIAPLYYLAIGYYFLQNFVGFDYYPTATVKDTTSAGEVISNILFLNGFSPHWLNHLVPGGWSITVEFTFYFFLPLICKRIKTINHCIIFLAATLMFYSMLRLNHVLGNTELNTSNFLNWFFPSQLPIFALGILAYFIGKGDYKVKASSFLVLAATCFIYCYLEIPEHFAYSLVFFALLFALSRQSIKLFANPVMCFIGKISFSIYLVHFAILYWLKATNSSDFISVSSFATALINYGIRYGVVLTLSCILCYFTYQYIELPFMNLGKKLIQRLTPEKESLPESALTRPIAFLETEKAL